MIALRDGVVRAPRLGAVALHGAIVACLVLAALAFGGWAIAQVAVIPALIGLLLTVVLGSALPTLGIFAQPILAGPPNNGFVALTFDDGPHAQHTQQVLNLLRNTQHRATFFVIGKRAEAQSTLIAAIAGDGHLLGNHSYSHKNYTPALPASRLAADLERTSQFLAKTTGQTIQWFRPPVGLITPPVAETARRAGLELVVWSATARDGVVWAAPQRALARLVSGVRAGAILVLHDGVASQSGQVPVVLQILPQLLAELDKRGLRSVTLDELLLKQPTTSERPILDHHENPV